MNGDTQNGSRELEILLNYLKRSRGFDFTGYKRTSLSRRVQKRMQTVGIQEYTNYQDYLEVHPEEFIHLFNTILINVTGFFREPEAWDFLAKNVLPSIIAIKPPTEPIRIWCAGSASGEEAYTVAMLLSAALGEPEASERVKIYATDLDEEALNKARLAVYTKKEVEPIPNDLLNRYFEPAGNQFAFRKEMRRILIFGRHDIIQDAPISRIDLIICRNLLMYFNAETQARVLERMYFALKNNAYLFLGKAEMLLTHSDLFTPIDLKHRIFTKVSK